MNAPLWIPNNVTAAPKPGAILLSEDSPLGRAGQWIDFDARGGGVVNLSTGARLPLAGGRQVPYEFAGAPPGPTDVHTPVTIANFMATYRNRRFLLDSVIPVQLTDYSQFSYRVLDSGATYLVVDARASEFSHPQETTFSTSVVTDKTQDLRLATFVPYRSEQQADFDFRITAARNLWTKIMLSREYAAFGPGAPLMTSGNWDSSVRLALAGNQNWGPPGNEGDDSDPPRDLREAIENSPEYINMFVMNLVQFHWFTSHPRTIDFFKAFAKGGNSAGYLDAAYTSAIKSDPSMIEPFMFEVPTIGKIFVHNALATTDPAVAADRFWSNDIVLGFHLPESLPPNGDISTAITFRLKNPTNGSSPGAMAGMPEGVPTNNGWTVRIVPLPLRGAGGDLIIADLSEKTVITADNTGAFISGVS